MSNCWDYDVVVVVVIVTVDVGVVVVITFGRFIIIIGFIIGWFKISFIWVFWRNLCGNNGICFRRGFESMEFNCVCVSFCVSCILGDIIVIGDISCVFCVIWVSDISCCMFIFCGRLDGIDVDIELVIGVIICFRDVFGSVWVRILKGICLSIWVVLLVVRGLMLGIFFKVFMDWVVESGVVVIGEVENGVVENVEILIVFVVLVIEDVVMIDCFVKFCVVVLFNSCCCWLDVNFVIKLVDISIGWVNFLVIVIGMVRVFWDISLLMVVNCVVLGVVTNCVVIGMFKECFKGMVFSGIVGGLILGLILVIEMIKEFK